ncbi:hypothetical protein NE235_11660 [Actinoallomurus spadix]|uniref:Uncharacterized protein n=1 Tax=Actinoallomurus spadix TaxID=79912 RepID=A0ABN0X4B3_9ACTN|nr:hypothetical protein [Actinoallomurus spadix]MCO5986757.1 hypothetical protein [Actinoallomurus spadix]
MAAEPVTTGTAFDRALAVADAILYEGYLLYPYRRSSAKNQVRWQFGVLTPRAWTEARGADDEGLAGSAEGWWQRTVCLLQAGEESVVQCRLRFLQLLRRSVEERATDNARRPADTISSATGSGIGSADRSRTSSESGTGGESGSGSGFDQAIPREFDLRFVLGEALAGERRFAFRAPGGSDVETLRDEDGRPVGRVTVRFWPVEASVTVSAARCPGRSRLIRLRVRVENADRTTPVGVPRAEALRRSLIAVHTIYAGRDASFVSLLDPPQWAEAEAKACANVRTFPVLAGPHGTRDLLLSSPIILYDHPRVAPESPGDLNDATEIDEILSLRTLTLTDAEKREARATDPRAAAIIDRVDAMPPEVLSRLHGAIRSLKPLPSATVAGDPRPSRWTPPDDAELPPGSDAVTVAGRRVAKGSRVRLLPREGGDPQDMFLAGRTGRVEAVLLDVDGSQHLAVTLEGDPGAGLDRWYGRFRYFSPAEVEPLDDNAGDPGGSEAFGVSGASGSSEASGGSGGPEGPGGPGGPGNSGDGGEGR